MEFALPKDATVLVLGAASWNRLIHVKDLPQGHSATIFAARESETAGSTGVGKAMALAAFGCAPVLQCSLGRDAHAANIIATCQDYGIRMLVDESDAPTAHHLNVMDENGGRYSIFLSNGFPDPQIVDVRLANAFSAASTIFLSLCVSSKRILHLLAGSKAEILLDLHDYDGASPWYDDFIVCADVIQLSDVALPEPRAIIDRLLSGRERQVVLTKGKEGAEIFAENTHQEIPICLAKMVDSNGAGDTFSVALWLAQRQGLSLFDAGKVAATAAAFAIEDPRLFPKEVSFAQVVERAATW